MKISPLSFLVSTISTSVVVSSKPHKRPPHRRVQISSSRKLDLEDLHKASLTTDLMQVRRLLSKATVIQEGHHSLRQHRRQNEDNNNNNNYDNEYGLYNLPQLYLQYTGCSSFLVPDQDDRKRRQLRQLDEQQQQQNVNQYYYNDGMETSNLVLFTLCDSADCSSCSGEYAVDMLEFLNTYTEMKMQADEQQCEYVREHCYCSYSNYKNNAYNNANQNNQNAYNNANENNNGNRNLANNNNNYNYNYNYYYANCLASCYEKAGLDNCMSDYYGGEEFQLQEYLECRRAFGDGNNNNNNNNKNYYNNYNDFYVGPYCYDYTNIFLGAFYDEDCSYEADAEAFQAMNYGDGFPYFDTPIIPTNECMSCRKWDENQMMYNNNNNNAYNVQQYGYYYYDNNGNDQGEGEENYESNELCEQATDEAIKCDSDRGYSSGCYFLETTLPCLDGRGCPETYDDDGSGNGSGGGGGSGNVRFTNNDMTTSELYKELMKKLRKNKRIAIAMGAIAGGFLLIIISAVLYCCCCMPSTPKVESLRQKALLTQGDL